MRKGGKDPEHWLKVYVIVIQFWERNFCIKILFGNDYFSPLDTFMRKGKDPDPDPEHWLKLYVIVIGLMCQGGRGSGSHICQARLSSRLLGRALSRF